VEAKPLVGETWAQAKAFWFQVFGYKLYAEEVKAYHESEAPIRITTAPARTSKSMSTAYDTLAYIMPTKPLTDSLHWIIGNDYSTNKEFSYLYECLVDHREKHGLPIERASNNPRNGDMLIVLDYGFNEAKNHRCRAVVKGMSCNNEKALQGEEVTTATLSEAAEHPPHILPKYLATRCWKMNLPTTPKPQAEWIKELSDKGARDSSLGVETFELPPHANPLYNYTRFEQQKRLADQRAKDSIGPHASFEDDAYFAEQFLGRWVYYTGMVLPFQKVRHVLVSAPPEVADSRKFVSLDYGYEDGEVALFWAVLPNGILVIFDEVYERHLTSQKFVEKIHDKLDAHEGADYVVGDPSQPQVARIMREAGLNVWDIDKNAMRDRAAGFTRLRDLLTEGPVEGYPGIYVTANCKKTIAEWGTLRFREGCRNEFANGSFVGADHAADAARYGIMTRPAPQHEPDTKHEWLRAHMRKVRKRKRASSGKMGTYGLKHRYLHG
jgi:hypothetical protein